MAARSGLSQGDDVVPLESHGSWPPEEAFEQDYYPDVTQHAAPAGPPAFAPAHEPLANRSNHHGAGHAAPHTMAKKAAAKQRKTATERKPRARKPREPKPAVPDGPKISHHLGSAGGGLGGYNSSTAHARSAATPLLSAEDYGLDGRDAVPWDRGMAAAHALAVRAATSSRRSGATPLHTDPQLPRASEIDLESLSKEQRYALDLAMTGKSFFFTGPGGTGKSYLLKVLVSQLLRKFAYKGVYVTASTGVAACNINGITLHAWAGLGLAEAPVDKLIGFLLRDSRKAKTKQRWLDAQVLIVDEVSMLAGDYFEKLDRVGRGVRNQPDLPFGGIQLIVAGDFLQLPPVRQNTWCFETKTWQEAIREVVQLTHVFRQSDREFVALLNDIRFGQVSSTTRHKLDACVGKKVPTGGAVKPTRLFPHKASVEEENLKEYAILDTEEVIYKSRDWGNPDYPDVLNSLQKDCQAAETLKLRVGAQVMLVKNVSLEEKLFNGARGVVVGFVEEKIVIDGREQVTKQRLPLVEWAHGGRTVVTQADFTAEIAGVNIASRTQIPLTHAWALSIHKAQGSTLDFVEVSLGETFEFGQSYVALSRARSLDGLFIRSINYKRIMAHPKALAFYRALPPAIFSPVAPAAASALDPLNRTAQQGEEKKAVPFPPPAFASAQAAMWAPAAATNLHAPTIAASQASVPQSQPIGVLAASQRPAAAAAMPASQGVVRHNLEISSFSRAQPPAFGAPSGGKVKPLPVAQRMASLSSQAFALPPPPPMPMLPPPHITAALATLPPPPPRFTLPEAVAVKSEPLIHVSTPPLPDQDVIVIDDSPARPASDGLTEGEARAPVKEIDVDDLSETEQEAVNARSNSERLSGGEDGKDRKRKLADDELSHSDRPASQPRGNAQHDALVTHSAYFDPQGSVPAPAPAAAQVQVFHVMPTFRQAVSEAKTPVTPASPQAIAPPPMEKLRPRVLDMGTADAPSEHAVGGADGVRVLDLTHATDYVEATYASQAVVFPSAGS